MLDSKEGPGYVPHSIKGLKKQISRGNGAYDVFNARVDIVDHSNLVAG